MKPSTPKGLLLIIVWQFWESKWRMVRNWLGTAFFIGAIKMQSQSARKIRIELLNLFGCLVYIRFKIVLGYKLCLTYVSGKCHWQVTVPVPYPYTVRKTALSWCNHRRVARPEPQINWLTAKVRTVFLFAPNNEILYSAPRYLENEAAFGAHYRWGMIYIRWVQNSITELFPSITRYSITNA